LITGVFDFFSILVVKWLCFLKYGRNFKLNLKTNLLLKGRKAQEILYHCMLILNVKLPNMVAWTELIGPITLGTPKTLFAE
jgi:hypothetical protein